MFVHESLEGFGSERKYFTTPRDHAVNVEEDAERGLLSLVSRGFRGRALRFGRERSYRRRP